MLMQPMVLLMLCTGGLFLAMKSMPEEEKRKMEADQKRMGIDPSNPFSALSSLFGSEAKPPAAAERTGLRQRAGARQ